MSVCRRHRRAVMVSLYFAVVARYYFRPLSMKSLLEELERARQRVRHLEQKVAEERLDLLASLPAKYGFSSVDDFADAVRASAGLPTRRRKAVNDTVENSETGLSTPYWRETPVPEEVPSTFVAQGIQASRAAAQAGQSEPEPARTPPPASVPAPNKPRVASEKNPAEKAPSDALPAASASISGATPAPAVPTSISLSPTPAPAAAPELQPATAPRPLPTGTSLSDPTQFGQLPDLSLLERGTKSDESFRAQLKTANTFAQQVLHTSKVPAAVWREWRDFARKAADVLRGGVAVA